MNEATRAQGPGFPRPGSGHRPKVSVIVVSYNRSADLRRSLGALLACGYPNAEVIVVDNSSGDGAAEVAESIRGVRVIRSGVNLGFAQGNNLGLQHADGAYLALVNNDAVVEAGWIDGLVGFLESHPRAAAAGGKLYFWDEDNPLGDRGNHYYAYTLVDARSGWTRPLVDAPDEVREVVTLSGAAVMIRRAAIEDVGEPFLEPDFFMYYEETDFFARAIRRGWRLFYTGEPVAWHRVGGAREAQTYAYKYYMHRNRLLYAYRNFAPRELRLIVRRTARHAVVETARHPSRVLLGGDETARARRDAWLWLIRNRGQLRRHRRRTWSKAPSYNEAVRAIQERMGYYCHPRPEVAALVPPGARRVVDVGCGAGALGRSLKDARPGIEVRGLEAVPEQAARAREVLDDVVVGNAEDGPPAGWPKPDCVIFADVLEHLVDPWTVLRRWRQELARGGTVVVSVPNVAHRTILWGLLRGRWTYVDAGILDRTHLRFFTRATAIELVEQAGFRVARVERVFDLPLRRLRKLLVRWLQEREKREPVDGGASGVVRLASDLCTVQFLILGV